MTPQQLRNSILQMAIEGKLTQQRPEDGDAADLLKEIKAEKARLVKEGKIKKEKPLPKIGEDEVPFEVPGNWCWVRFGDITINRDAERIPLSVEQRTLLKKEFDYYGASGVIDKVEDYLFDKTLLLIGEDGANLLSRSTPIAFLAKGKYWVNNHAHVIDCTENMCLPYIMWYINSITLAPYVTGTAQPKMNQSKMNSIMVALPPYAEQCRIVERIEEILPQVDAYEKAYNELQQLNKTFPGNLKNSLLQLAVQGKLVDQRPEEGTAADLLKQIQAEKAKLVKEKKIKKEKPLSAITEEEIPFEISEGWCWCKLGNLVYLDKGTKTKNGIKPYLEAKYIRGKSEANYKESGVLVESGNYVILVDGENSGEIFELTEEGYLGSTFNILNFIQKDARSYLLLFISKNKKYLRDNKKGAAIPHLNRNLFNNLIVPLPPIAEQKRIVAKLEQLSPLCDTLAKIVSN